LTLGLISRIDALRRLNPEVKDDAEAIERLLAVDRIEAILKPTTPTTPAAASDNAERTIQS